MPELTFSQPERRSFLVPVLLALAALGLAIALAIHFFPATTVNIDHVHTDILPTETVIKGGSIVGGNEVDRVLYVVSTIRVDNQLRVPISLDDFHITLTTAEDTEIMEPALREREFPDIETNYPALKPLITKPLARDIVIEPRNVAQGNVVFALNIPKERWDKRKSAVIKVDVYHQPAVYATIPQ